MGSELSIFGDLLFKHYKELVHERLAFAEFSTYAAAYSASVRTVEELTGKKVGLKFSH
jgi:hypothetical protein